MKDSILVLDIETVGGFTTKDGFIVEIGMVDLNIKNGEISELFNSVCKEPGLNASHRKSWIFENSDLTVEEVRAAPMFDEIKPKVQEIISKYKNGASAFNHAFDFGHLEYRGIVFHKKLDCPMKLLTPIIKLPSKNGRSGYKWPSVTESMNFLFPDCDYVESHRGYSDAYDEAGIIWEMIQRGWFKI